MLKSFMLVLLCLVSSSCIVVTPSDSHKSTATAPAVDDTVVYAFDGTSQNVGHGDYTNVYQFLMAHRASGMIVKDAYASGVGTGQRDKSLAGIFNIPGKITGVGGRKRVNQMYDALVRNFREGHKGIVIVGFSRGAALSREFANVIKDRGDPLRYRAGHKPVGKPPVIKFMGLFDTVYSFGSPIGRKDLGYRKSIPYNVRAVAHATAALEKRNTFDLWSIHFRKKYLNKTTGSLARGNYRAERAFNGGHDDVGGAEKYKYFGLAPLQWVLVEGRKAGVSLGSPDIKYFRRKVGQKPNGKGFGKRQIYFPKPGR